MHVRLMPATATFLRLARAHRAWTHAAIFGTRDGANSECLGRARTSSLR